MGIVAISAAILFIWLADMRGKLTFTQ